MRVQCIAEYPSQEQIRQLGQNYRPGKTVYPVQPGIEYLVLGLGMWEGISWVELAMETEVVVSVPLFLFEITDSRCSRLWEVRTHEDGALTLWPGPFYEKYFHDHLSEGCAAEVATLRALQQQMAAE